MTEGFTIAITREIPDIGINLCRQHGEVRVHPGFMPPTTEELDALLDGADAVLSLPTDTFSPDVMNRHPRLKVISNFAVGYDNVDVPAATERGIAVCNTPGVLTDATAEIAWTLIMMTARRAQEGIDHVRNGDWLTWGPKSLLGQPIVGATLGIIGFGRIGQSVARMSAGFGMKILAWDRHPETKDPGDLPVEFCDFERVLRESDFVSVHVALSSETTNLIDADALALMKPSAILINTSRGPVVDQDALVSALENGTIFAAGLDVTTPEPLAHDHPLATMSNCTVLPHIGSATITARDGMARLAAENLIAVLTGQEPPSCLNPEVLTNTPNSGQSGA